MSCVYVDWLSAESGWNSSTPILLATSQHKRMTIANCYIFRVVPPDDEQYTCSKHVVVNH